jgi:hypothetical protein
MFRIEMLPAAHGDCLWIEYGTSADVHRILIDGGPAHAYPDLRSRIALLPRAQRCFDLLVISHIDADHIEGVVRLLCDAEALGCTFDRIWFNGREQLDAVPDPAGEPLGSVQGEIVGVLIHAYEDRTGTRVWNQGFDGAIAVDRHSDTLPTVTLPGNCRLAVLSPGQAELLDLKYHWVRELDKAHVSSGDEAALLSRLASDRRLRPLGDVLGGPDADAERDEAADAVEADLPDALGGDSGEPGGDAPFGSDTSRTNASSIALLLEYPAVAPTVRFLLAADAWPSVVERSLDLLVEPGQRLAVTGFKVAHHGSVANVTSSLLDKLACTHYLFSTSGAVFGHPHARCVGLVLASHHGPGKPRLHFNYNTTTTTAWSDPPREAGYRAFHPQGISLVC